MSPPSPPASPPGDAALLSRLRALEEKLKCPLCHQLFEWPVAPPCGHVFCSYCIRVSLSDKSACPLPSCGLRAFSDALRPLPTLSCERVPHLHAPPPRARAAARALPALRPGHLPHALSKQLRRELVAVQLPASGGLSAMRARYREYVLVCNAAIDGGLGGAAPAVAADRVRRWEAARARARGAGGAFCVAGRGEMRVGVKRARGETRELSCVGDGDVVESDFDALVARVDARAQRDGVLAKGKRRREAARARGADLEVVGVEEAGVEEAGVEEIGVEEVGVAEVGVEEVCVGEEAVDEDMDMGDALDVIPPPPDSPDPVCPLSGVTPVRAEPEPGGARCRPATPPPAGDAEDAPEEEAVRTPPSAEWLSVGGDAAVGDAERAPVQVDGVSEEVTPLAGGAAAGREVPDVEAQGPSAGGPGGTGQVRRAVARLRPLSAMTASKELFRSPPMALPEGVVVRRAVHHAPVSAMQDFGSPLRRARGPLGVSPHRVVPDPTQGAGGGGGGGGGGARKKSTREEIERRRQAALRIQREKRAALARKLEAEFSGGGQ